MGHWESSLQREIHSITVLPRETRIISNSLTLHLKKLETEQQTKPKGIRRKELMKIRAEISEIESKKLVQNINESQS